MQNQGDTKPGCGEVVRIVAAAICKSRSCEGYSCCQWPANLGRTRCPAKLGGYDDAASAAINAICHALLSPGNG